MATVVNRYNFVQSPLPLTLPDQAHIVQFYTRDSFLLDGLAISFGKALEAGESVVVAMTKIHQRGLLRRLSAQGIDIAGLSRSGRLTVLDAALTLQKFMDPAGPNRQRFFHLIGNVIRRAERSAEVKARRVIVFGEMVAVLWRQKQCDAAIRLEQLWNELAETHFFYLRCAYPAKWFKGPANGEPYATICAEHSVVIPA